MDDWIYEVVDKAYNKAKMEKIANAKDETCKAIRGIILDCQGVGFNKAEALAYYDDMVDLLEGVVLYNLMRLWAVDIAEDIYNNEEVIVDRIKIFSGNTAVVEMLFNDWVQDNNIETIKSINTDATDSITVMSVLYEQSIVVGE